MKPQSPDTDLAAEAVQIELLRRMGATRRSMLMRSLTRTAVRLARAALERAHPELSPEELKLKFIEVHYGRDLAERVAAYLRQRAG